MSCTAALSRTTTSELMAPYRCAVAVSVRYFTLGSKLNQAIRVGLQISFKLLQGALRWQTSFG
jgi:hypothetical protein